MIVLTKRVYGFAFRFQIYCSVSLYNTISETTNKPFAHCSEHVFGLLGSNRIATKITTLFKKNRRMLNLWLFRKLKFYAQTWDSYNNSNNIFVVNFFSLLMCVNVHASIAISKQKIVFFFLKKKLLDISNRKLE